jgi:hypothetical protein
LVKDAEIDETKQWCGEEEKKDCDSGFQVLQIPSPKKLLEEKGWKRKKETWLLRTP